VIHAPTIATLVRSLEIAPAGRYRVAQVLAQMQDVHGGTFRATMGRIAAAAKLSPVQARKHVHALIADGLLAVVGNASGGAPGAGSSYAFNQGLLERLVACTPDLFSEPRAGLTTEPDDAYCFTVNGARFLAVLVGMPGARCVVFWRVDGEHANYGDVPLKVLLCDPRSRGGWHCHISPHGDPDVPYEQMFRLTREDVALLANWAQNAALGRVESLTTA